MPASKLDYSTGLQTALTEGLLLLIIVLIDVCKTGVHQSRK